MAKDYKEIKAKLDQKKISLKQILEAIKKDAKTLNDKKVGLEALQNKKAKENQKPENKGQNNKPSSPSDNKPNTNNKANTNDNKSKDDEKTSEDAAKIKNEKFRKALVNLKMAYKRALAVLERAENYMETAKMPKAKRAKLEVLVIRQKLILEKVRILIEKLEANA